MVRTINTNVSEFIKKVKKKLNPEKIILFGSRARDDYLEDSDYDFVIISAEFKGMHFHDRIVRVLRLMKKPFPLYVICLTPEEFKSSLNKITILREAVNEGITI